MKLLLPRKNKFSSFFHEGISILIPTWNNLPYLKLCVESLQAHSQFDNEIIIHVNEGTDGTLDWVQQKNLKFSFAEKNTGVCSSLNRAFELATKSLICYFNDDFYALPQWDQELFLFSNNLSKNVLLSSVMIEPLGDNPCCLISNYGTTHADFEEHRLLADCEWLKTQKSNFVGNTYLPNIIHRDLWKQIGGYSEEFDPGFGSDPDFIKKLHDVGVRDFIGVGRSMVYHFGSKTTAKIKDNNSGNIFLQKHGIGLVEFVLSLRIGMPVHLPG